VVIYSDIPLIVPREKTAEIAKCEISKLSGITTSVAVLIIIVVALAGLGLVVVNSLTESSWGTFTIAATIPIALLMGVWMSKIRKGKMLEATIFGVLLLILAVVYGRYIPDSPFASWFTFNHNSLTCEFRNNSKNVDERKRH